MRKVATILLVLLLAAAAAVYYVAGRSAVPAIQINQPGKFVGRQATLDATVESPGSQLNALNIALEQKGRTFALFSLASQGAATVKQETPDRVRITLPVGKAAIPDLEAGPARVVVTASRPVLGGVRVLQSTAAHDFQVLLIPPSIGPVSSFHFINSGGSEMVVYRVTPADVKSGVMVGDLFYPGFPASQAGVHTSDPSLKVAFFALLFDEDLNTPISLYAVDAAGNQAHAQFDYRVFEKPRKRSRIEISDAFLGRVVPAIMEHSPEVKPKGDLLQDFLTVNRDLRRIDADRIDALSRETSSTLLWKGAFHALTNAQVESGFADHRTYYYKGQEIDQQVHLGFDLAVTANIPVLAANDGKVVWADYLGIYGNCVIIDHGMGVQSLYGHLSSIDVKAGDAVRKEQQIGRSGMTGLAGGDHLHFAMLIDGRPVNPVEWWDPHWIADRVTRKLEEAGR
jgi:murein DD-endopeptidase MepM/ murein hydrolase activator NlpD